jgi:hypothetical protein
MSVTETQACPCLCYLGRQNSQGKYTQHDITDLIVHNIVLNFANVNSTKWLILPALFLVCLISTVHRYRKSLNRLLKACYVPATSAVLMPSFLLFLLRPLTALMKQTRQPVCDIRQPFYLDVYGTVSGCCKKRKMPWKMWR